MPEKHEDCEVKDDIMELKSGLWRLLALSITLMVGLLGGCSSLGIYFMGRQADRIAQNEERSIEAVQKVEGLSRDIIWVKDALNRIEMRQTGLQPIATKP